MDPTMTRRIGPPSKGSKLQRLEGFEASKVDPSRVRGLEVPPKVDYLSGVQGGLWDESIEDCLIQLKAEYYRQYFL